MKRRIFSLIAADIIGFILTFCFASILYIAYHLEDLEVINAISFELVLFYIFSAVIGILYFLQQGHYRLASPWWEQVKHILLFSIFSLFLLSLYYFVIKGDTSRLFVVLSWAGIAPFLMVTRQLARYILLSRNLWKPKTIIIGGFENTVETIFALKSETYISYDITSVILPQASAKQIKEFKQIHSGYDVKTSLPEFEKDTLVIICPDTRRELALEKITQEIMDAGADFAVVPPIEGFSYYGLQPHFFFGYNIALLRSSRNLTGFLNQFIKNVMDRVGAGLGLLILSPLFAYIAYKVRQDGGPVFYASERLGKGGKKFKCWKFRTMVVNSKVILEEHLAVNPKARKVWERDFKLKDDPRITAIGDKLRKSSLDELPQLLNVLLGEMSLVGPRPILEKELGYSGADIKHYYSLRPGLTGLWQVSGRSDINFTQRVYLDRWYVRHWSFWTDIVIIIKTIFAVLSKRGAY